MVIAWQGVWSDREPEWLPLFLGLTAPGMMLMEVKVNLAGVTPVWCRAACKRLKERRSQCRFFCYVAISTIVFFFIVLQRLLDQILQRWTGYSEKHRDHYYLFPPCILITTFTQIIYTSVQFLHAYLCSMGLLYRCYHSGKYPAESLFFANWLIVQKMQQKEETNQIWTNYQISFLHSDHFILLWFIFTLYIIRQSFHILADSSMMVFFQPNLFCESYRWHKLYKMPRTYAIKLIVCWQWQSPHPSPNTLLIIKWEGVWQLTMNSLWLNVIRINHIMLQLCFISTDRFDPQYYIVSCVSQI